MIKLLRDSRDLIYARKYGQVPVLPTEYNVDTPHADTVQPAGNVMCTAISTCDIAVDQTGVQYDYEELFSRVPSNKDGAEPREVLKEAVKNGLTPLDVLKKGIRDKKWKAFYRADEGGMDKFDNIRSAIYLAQSPIAMCTPWYWEWMNKSILSPGENFTNYHMYVCEGWTEINGEPHLIIEAWLGRKMYMSREVCNKVMSSWGAQAWVLATDEIDSKRTKNILQKIVDALVNVIILLKAQLALKQMPEPIKTTEPEVKPKRDLLNEFCLAIRDFEGKPGDLNYRNNNPGNIRSVEGPFMKFKTYDEGFAYLKEYVKRAARGSHKAYKIGATIQDFFNVYAPSSDNNHPEIYARYVAKRLGVGTDFKIIQLL